jgi:putative DNA-invertase from lambdoid prophage Rac
VARSLPSSRRATSSSRRSSTGCSARPSTRHRVEDLRKRGVSLCLLDLGGDISGNAMSKLFLTIADAFAEAQRDRIRERISQVKAHQKVRGRYLGGTVPFGFKRGDDGKLISHEMEQEGDPRD